MALNVEKQTTPGGGYTALNLVSTGFAKLVVEFSSEQPAVARWTMAASHHTRPLDEGDFVRIWDDAGTTPDTTAQSSSNPLFEGFVDEVQPGQDGLTVAITAYDPTVRAAEYPIMSGAWVTGTPPTEAATGFPRQVFNAKIDTDADFAYEALHDATIGAIFKQLFDDLYQALIYTNAANSSTTKAYVQTDLDLFTFKPQEKVVFESESMRSAIERVLQQYDPGYRMLFTPGERRWRFYDSTAATEVDLTLNDYDASNVVLSLEIHRSVKDRYTAVKIFGPQSLTQISPTLDGGGLSLVSSGVLLQNNIGTCCDVEGIRQIQIVDSDFWRVAPVLATPVNARIGDFSYIEMRTPHLLGYFPAGTNQIFPGWRLIPHQSYDPTTGIISLPADMYIQQYDHDPGAGNPNYITPTDLAFTYAYPDAIISTRFPTSGYSGTVYTEIGLERTLWMYDEMLAVGYEFGTPVTSATRLAQFAILAERLHAMRSRTIYTGGCTLDGIRYEFCRLNRRVNFPGVDADGDPLTTGWEDIGALLTDVEYNFEDMTTTLTFSSDLAEEAGLDIDEMKARLNVRALWKNTWSFAQVKTTLRNKTFSDGNAFSFIGDTLQDTWTINSGSDYRDEFGNLESIGKL